MSTTWAARAARGVCSSRARASSARRRRAARGSVAASTTTRPGLLGSGRSVRAQAVDCSRQRELCGAETRDEPAAAGTARFFERAQHRVDAGESARRAFGAHGLAGDHAVAVEQLQRDGVRDLRGRGRRVQQRRDERPPAGTRGAGRDG